MRIRSIFVGGNGLRAGWRLAIFIVIAKLGGNLFLSILLRLGYKTHHGWHPLDFLVSDGLGFVALLIAALVMAWIERRRVGSYGLPAKGMFGARFWQGIAWGAGSVAVLAMAMVAGGGLRISGLALHGRSLIGFALAWAVTMIVLGLFEESLFRGYPQITLASGMGFWSAAVLLSLAFGALHYFTKPHETLVDATSVALIGLFLCFTLKRTGNIWFAVGYHAAFDYVALIVLASPNTGMGTGGERVVGHLLTTTFPGPAWITGGACGMEASLFIFPILLASFALFHHLYPPQRATAEGRVEAAASVRS
ncbi:MAG TPA: type II CAAX endopeptidase family protein [Thermoanaerobaculia bacterium]|nr:type II CAAX endopeptidase family protein [Thermoanaerobaculia bacterium]